MNTPMNLSFRDFPLWAPCASVALAMAWLLPNASPPWLAFHKDALTGLVFFVVATVFLVKSLSRPIALSLDPLSIVLSWYAIWTIGQWLFGQIYFFGHALLGALYFFAAALCVMIARAWEEDQPNAVGNFVFASVLIAAVFTTGIMSVQWLRLDILPVWIQPITPWGRPFGNLVQPNNAATLLVLGIVALLWFWHAGRIRYAIAIAASLYLVAFLALTGSRTGLASFSLLAIAGTLVAWRRAQQRIYFWAGPLLVVFLCALIYLLGVDWSDGQESAVAVAVAEPIFQRDLTSARFQIYAGYLQAVLDRPFAGYGFEQTINAQIALGAKEVFLPGLVTWAHNALLDVALWFGLGMALLLIAAILLAAASILRSPPNTSRLIYLSGIFAVGVHGMLELPLGYAYFLLPTAALTGAALAGTKLSLMECPKVIALALTLLCGLTLSAVTHDYLKIESSFYAWRFKQNRVGLNHPDEAPNTLVLDQMEALLRGLHSTKLDNDQLLEDFRAAVLLHPSAAAVQHLAELQLKHGDPAAAQVSADFGWLISDSQTRRALAQRWLYLGAEDPAFKAVRWKGE